MLELLKSAVVWAARWVALLWIREKLDCTDCGKPEAKRWRISHSNPRRRRRPIALCHTCLYKRMVKEHMPSHLCQCPHENCGQLFYHLGAINETTYCPHCGKQQKPQLFQITNLLSVRDFLQHEIPWMRTNQHGCTCHYCGASDPNAQEAAVAHRPDCPYWMALEILRNLDAGRKRA